MHPAVIACFIVDVLLGVAGQFVGPHAFYMVDRSPAETLPESLEPLGVVGGVASQLSADVAGVARASVAQAPSDFKGRRFAAVDQRHLDHLRR